MVGVKLIHTICLPRNNTGISGLGQLIEKVLSECEANLDPNYLRYTILSVRGSGVGCRGGECRGSR